MDTKHEQNRNGLPTTDGGESGESPSFLLQSLQKRDLLNLIQVVYEAAQGPLYSKLVLEFSIGGEFLGGAGGGRLSEGSRRRLLAGGGGGGFLRRRQ